MEEKKELAALSHEELETRVNELAEQLAVEKSNSKLWFDSYRQLQGRHNALKEALKGVLTLTE